MISWEERRCFLRVFFKSFRAGKGMYNFAFTATVCVNYIDKIE
jgi:hypothetical protein